MTRPVGDVRNDRKNAVTKFCLAMEEHRRSDAGRVRTAREMLDFFFPRAAAGAEDRIFLHIPQEVRGPIISAWGVRGAKSAVRDSDEKVCQVVFDALVAGDIDEVSFEDGIDSQTLIDWAPLTEWWTFWRTGKLTGVAVQKALAVGRELGLFDDRWFLLNVDGRGGKLKGTDTICDTLSKDQIVAWVRKLHESGDGSPAGLVGAVGWEMILSKTSQEALLFALDAFAKKVGLLATQPSVQRAHEPEGSSVTQAAATEMPRGDENTPVPEIPALEPPRLPPDNDGAALASDVVTSASAAYVRSSPMPPAQSGTMLSNDEVPISVQEVEPPSAQSGLLRAHGAEAPSVAQSGLLRAHDSEKPKLQPPPVPSTTTRKGAR